MNDRDSKQLLEQLTSVVGADRILTDDESMSPYLIDWRRRFQGKALAVLQPTSTQQVAEIVKRCAATRTSIVPQGGNSGLAGGATPDSSGTQVVISLSRLNRIRQVDPLNNTMTVEAGCTLASVQEAAREVDRLFPLSLAAEGTCEIGGNISTNAGGTAVLRYGNTRELVLGLEVVLANGEIWDGLRGLRKDNSGYDLKQIFIGSEGTLGIITAAVLEMFPRPSGQAIALTALSSIPKCLELLTHARRAFGAGLTGFEVFTSFCLDLVSRHFEDCRPPFRERHSVYALLELSDSRADSAVRELLASALATALEGNILDDAVLAESLTHGQAFWGLRENISEAQAREGKNIKHDVSLPASAIAEFLSHADHDLEVAYPGVRLVCFGHLGDGNLHYNVSAPAGIDSESFLANQPAINRIVHDHVVRLGGSITAEHGIGQLRRMELQRYKSPLEIEMMRKLKAAFDPFGILNPGKIL